ncbi:MAG TPA: hypothetical protein VOA41_02995 [Candidatus Dormibacteraeota bacterium]|nr:hypothetical protein [Candidatus Dormibacteraeota bacterium]
MAIAIAPSPVVWAANVAGIDGWSLYARAARTRGWNPVGFSWPVIEDGGRLRRPTSAIAVCSKNLVTFAEDIPAAAVP